MIHTVAALCQWSECEMRMFGILVGSAVLVASSGAASAADFAIGFDWGGLKKCTSGNPNTVNNPKFTLNSVPKGTASIRFRMVDLKVPSYPHGGGTVKYSAGSSIQPGAFKYQ